MYTRIINRKGQVTLPSEIRRRLGVSNGDRLEFVVSDAQVMIRPAGKGENIFEPYIGAACV